MQQQDKTPWTEDATVSKAARVNLLFLAAAYGLAVFFAIAFSPNAGFIKPGMHHDASQVAATSARRS